jgi:hypothetical protein|tara:strand:- start:1908 stop:4412 length:2505 start_codon:yes stop_codon:yes gene_type:complete
MPNQYFDQLIDQLKPLVYDTDFDTLFQSLTENEDGPTRFKLKMELRRLAAPCHRTVDLRNQVDGECHPYEYNGRRHQLDDVAIEIFERGLETYKGVFTQDTFEQILDADNHLRQAREEERAFAQSLADHNAEPLNGQSPFPNADNEAESYLLETFHFGQYPYRAEERMNFTIEVGLEDSKGQTYNAVTTDISITGMRVRVDDEHSFQYDELISLYFTGLAKEFTVDPDTRIPYRVVGVQEVDNKHYLKLNRDPDYHSAELDKFFHRFINGYKKRYRVNVDNTYNTIITKGHEQLLLPRMQQLPVFFSESNRQLVADYVLTTDNNRFILNNWINELNQISFGSVFNVRRSRWVLQDLLNKKSARLLILTFSITARGKIYNYSATVEELQKTGLWETYVAFGSQKASWRVYQIDLRPVDLNQAWQPQSVPKNINVPFRLNPPTAQVKRAISPLRYMGVVNDITDSLNGFFDTELDKNNLSSLKAFAHPPAVPIRTKEARLEFINLRSEKRFSYRSRCRVRVGKYVRDGMIIDLSVSGLQVQIDTPVAAEKGDNVEISMTGFKKLYKKAKLEHLPYTIASVDDARTTLRLKIDGDHEQHMGSEFIRFLIREQRDLLKLQVENTSINGLELCLRNLYCDAPGSLPIFFYRNKKRKTSVRRAGLSNWPSDWVRLLSKLPGSQQSALNLQPLMRGSSVTEKLLPKLEDMDRTSEPVTLLLLLRLYRQSGEDIVQTQWLESNDNHAIESFIEQCLPNSIFRAVRVTLSRTGKPDTQFIQAELNYISRYAAYRAQEIEEDLWQVYAIADTVDVTESLLEFALPDTNTIEEQQERLNTWLNKF